jgi:hypothetical protein
MLFHFDISVMCTDAQQLNDWDVKYCTYKKKCHFFYNTLEIFNLLSYGLT